MPTASQPSGPPKPQQGSVHPQSDAGQPGTAGGGHKEPDVREPEPTNRAGGGNGRAATGAAPQAPTQPLAQNEPCGELMVTPANVAALLKLADLWDVSQAAGDG